MTPATQTNDQPRDAVDPLDPGRLAEELVRIGRTAIAKPDDAALDGFFTEDFKFHGPAGDLDRDDLKAFFASMRAAFSDFAVEREQILVRGNWLASRTRMSGTFDREFTAGPLGPAQPTGRPVSFAVFNFFRYEDDGRLAEEWAVLDNLDLLRQLGVDVEARTSGE
jgi:predicted ester cyclase